MAPAGGLTSGVVIHSATEKCAPHLHQAVCGRSRMQPNLPEDTCNAVDDQPPRQGTGRAPQWPPPALSLAAWHALCDSGMRYYSLKDYLHK